MFEPIDHEWRLGPEELLFLMLLLIEAMPNASETGMFMAASSMLGALSPYAVRLTREAADRLARFPLAELSGMLAEWAFEGQPLPERAEITTLGI